MHPRQLEALAKAHTEELRRRPSRLLPARGRGRRSVRDATGWFLVDLGLRLALRRPSAAATIR